MREESLNSNLLAGPILVTGAAGFIGFHTCTRLLADGRDVIGVDALNTYYDPELKEARLKHLRESPRFSFHRVDVSNDEALSLLASQRRPSAIIHLAAQAGVRYSLENPGAYVHSNLSGFGSILEVARRYDVAHLVYASSSSVYGATSRIPFDVHDPADHPVSLYAATKRSNELMAHSYSYLFGIPTTGLRFFTVYGPWGRPDMAYFAFARAILLRQPLTLFGDGSVVRDFTYVDDVVESLVRVLERPPAGNTEWTSEAPDLASSSAPFRLYNIGHGGQASIKDLIQLIEELTGLEAVVRTQASAAGDVPLTMATTHELERLTGYRPDTSLREGMGRFVDWLQRYLMTDDYRSA